MIYILMLSTLLIGFIVSLIVSHFFKKPISNILQRLIDDEIYTSWVKYMMFAIYVVGISSGVNLWQLEKYITPDTTAKVVAVQQLTSIRWIFEIYRSLISSLQSLAWLLLVFYIIALIVFVMKKIFVGRNAA